MLKYLRLGLKAGPKVACSLHWAKKTGKNPGSVPPLERYKRIHSYIHHFMDVAHIKYFVGGMENIPSDSNCLFTPNHQSNLDPLVFIDLLMLDFKISFLSKKETEDFIFIGNNIKMLEGFFIDRGDLRSEIKTIKKMSEKLEEGELSYFVFPEGTRTKDENKVMGEFKDGAFKSACNSSKPIVPICLYGTFRPVDQKLHLKWYPVQVKFLKPINPADFDFSTQLISKEVRRVLELELDKMRIRDKELMKGTKKKFLKQLQK